MTDSLKTIKDMATSLLGLVEQVEEAEHHAFSVRQLIAQRDRFLEILNILGSDQVNVARADLQEIFRCIGLTSSQFYQDIFCLLLNDGKRDGFFVEFGSCDGLVISNTYIFEKYFGWKGILAEPSHYWREAIQKNRSCNIDYRCVWSESGKRVQFVDHHADDYMTQSSVVSVDQSELSAERTYDVETVTLHELLAGYNAPKVIDFISIDVEGAEVEVLEGFNFSKYKFNFAAIETRFNKDKIEGIMQSKGYVPILQNASGHDTLFVPPKIAKKIMKKQLIPTPFDK